MQRQKNYRPNCKEQVQKAPTLVQFSHSYSPSLLATARTTHWLLVCVH